MFRGAASQLKMIIFIENDYFSKVKIILTCHKPRGEIYLEENVLISYLTMRTTDIPSPPRLTPSDTPAGKRKTKSLTSNPYFSF